jgi:putative spermidine/putrescine transport system ATP-binding protein
VNNAVSMTGFLELDALEKRFGELPVTRGVSLSAEKGEIVALLGPSGSGKTTILRLTAGFESLDAGRIVVEGEDVTGLAPERRRFGMVFQHYALFPHMTAGENVAFGLESQGAPRDMIAKRVAEMLAATGLSGLEKRKVTQLSGGQQQRVALARALAPSPRVLLLDEPLSNLDPSLREKTRRELKRFIGRIGITTLFVTHEQEEAFALGDRVALLNAGRLEQIGTPEDLYERPATRFVATFIGRSSVLPAYWRKPEARIVGGPAWTAVEGAPVPDGAEADLVVRPEGLAFAGTSAAGALEGTISERRFAGLAAYFGVATAAGEIEVLAPAAAHREGDRVAVVPSAAGPAPRVFPRSA